MGTFFGNLLRGAGKIVKKAVNVATGGLVFGGSSATAQPEVAATLSQPVTNPLSQAFAIPEGSLLDGIKKVLNNGVGVNTKVTVSKNTLLYIILGALGVFLIIFALKPKRRT